MKLGIYFVTYQHVIPLLLEYPEKEGAGKGGRNGKENYNPMKLAPFVALRLAPGILTLASAKLAKILGSAWDNVSEELKGDAAEGFALQESASYFLVISR